MSFDPKASKADAAQLRDFIIAVIAERTMPREWSFPDDNWLMPYYQIVESSKAIEAHLDAIHEQIELLRKRVDTIEKELRKL